MNLRDVLNKTITVEFNDVSVDAMATLTGDDAIVAQVHSLAASAGVVVSAVDALLALYQPDEAHDTCSLTACLNPLHPGPCKGWKGTLFDAAPGAFHALEKAKADKANATRVKKIRDLKAKGLPIPKKLLVEIKPKAHPHEGQTAKSATGEAHAAGKAISEANGIKVSHPGKVSLGMASKSMGPVQLGPKGKKPTVASKGIAHVIAQEKVTPQYKLDKAATITPEQWNALSGDDKATIRGELANIKKDGFGPQQKKATDQLAKLDGFDKAKPEAKPETVTTPSGQIIQKVTLKDTAPVVKEMQEPSKTPKLGDTAPAPKKGSSDQHGILNKPHVGGEVKSTTVGLPTGYKLSKDSLGYTLKYNGKIIRTSSNQENLEKFAVEHKAAVDAILAKHKAAGTPQVNANFEVSKLTPEKVAELNKTSAPALDTVTTPSGKTYQKVDLKGTPKHVQDAVDMANGHAPGASWSKNHLAAYQKLSPEEFHGLPPETQGKIVAELKKGETKFLDPKKIQATKDLLAKFGKGPATPTVDKVAKPKIENVDFAKDLHSHNVTHAQAAEAVKNTAMSAHFLAAAKSAGLVSGENPDSGIHKINAAEDAKALVGLKTKLYNKDILDQPQVKDATHALHLAAQKQALAQSVADAKAKAFNKVSKKLYADGHPDVADKLSPIEKASLLHYQKHLLNHSSPPTTTPDLDALKADTKAAGDALDIALHDAVKKANAPSPDNMSQAQITDRAKELLGPDAHKTIFMPSETQMAAASQFGKQEVADASGKYSPDVLTSPGVAAKKGDFEQAAVNMAVAKTEHSMYAQHLTENHIKAMTSGLDINGNHLTEDDKKVLAKHAAQLSEATGLDDDVTNLTKKFQAAKTAFHDTADAAQDDADAAKMATPPEPVTLSDFDQQHIPQAFEKAWTQQASKAVVYGLKTYDQKQQMKNHPEYAPLTQDLGNLKVQAGKVALAHAAETTAERNVPFNPVTGDHDLNSPEWQAWQMAIGERIKAEEKFAALHKSAQAKLDTIRTSVGLKKRALPKVDAPAVKTAAAETGFYSSKGYGGPNFNKAASAKSYMLAKVGPKLGVVHKTSVDKANEKYGAPAPVASTAKIENVVPAGSPVNLGGGDSIAHIPDPLKKTITSDFKSAPSGKYLADPTGDIFDNLVLQAAVHGKTLDGGLSVDQVLKTIDETHSKNLGVANSGMLHKKITDWLGTSAGKQYAETHSTPDPKKLKALSGELDLPEGVTLAPGEKVQKKAGPGPLDTSLKATDFEKITASKMRDLQAKQMAAEGIKWTPAQKHGLNQYSGSQYPFNTYLRDQAGASNIIKQQVIDIQSTMMPAPANILLRRGTGYENLPPSFQSAEGAKKLIGKTFQDKGFVSSTVAGESGHFSSHPLQLTIEAPKGTPGVWMNDVSEFKDKENEYLLAAGTKFQVISVESKGGATHMRVRVVSD
jgi:hypothetical protein